MSYELYDLGMRLAAARSGKPAARLTRAPLPPPSAPVAVRAALHNGLVTAAAAVPGVPEQQASGPAALGMLEAMGVQVTAPQWRTLVTQDDTTLPALAALAAANPGGRHAAAAAHIGWWAARADFPGSTGVVPLLRACRERWVTGTAPAYEASARTWRAWLRVPGSSCTAMLAMLARVQAGTPLPLLSSIEEDTARSWEQAQSAFAAGAGWQRPDTAGRAAAGLWARNDAADLYAAALLWDPLYRRRAVHTGHVITGTARFPDPATKTFTVICDRADGRLREADEVTGWAGGLAVRPEQVFRGTVTAAEITSGTLTLTVSCSRRRPGDRAQVTLHAADPYPKAMKSLRDHRERLYRAPGSWMAAARTPRPERRDVPLAVMIAAAGG